MPSPNTPTRKVGAAALGGALATVIVWALSLAHVEVPAEVAAAMATLCAFAAGYIVKDNG